MTKKYVEQWERTKRFMTRFEALSSGVNHTHASDNYEDDMQSFFMHCYHLKDWIKNDPYCAAWQSVEQFIQADPHLPICADLCNALKHLTRTTNRSQENPQFGGSAIKLDIQEGGVKASVQIEMSFIVTTTKHGNIDALNLARNCMDSWKQFIASNDP